LDRRFSWIFPHSIVTLSSTGDVPVELVFPSRGHLPLAARRDSAGNDFLER
jgi:hypothetical protein